MDYRIFAFIITIVIVSSVSVLYIIDIKQQLLHEQSRHFPERVVFVDGQLSEFFGGSQEIKKLSSPEEVQKFITTLMKNNLSYGDMSGFWESADQEFALMESRSFRANTGTVSLDSDAFPAPSMAPVPEPEPKPMLLQARDESHNGNTEYSTTNIQVKRVDEPDFLKTDGKYVYMVRENKISIIDAYPAKDAQIVFTSAFDIEPQNLQNIFLNGDRLVIFYYGTSQTETIPEFDFEPRLMYRPTTHASIIDISDRQDPKIVRDYEIDGSFHNARMIEDYAYLVTVSGVDYQYPIVPIIMEDSELIMTPDVYYFDNFDRNYNFNTVTAINVFEDDMINSETFLMGGSGTLYVSEDSLYITYQQSLPHRYFDEMRHDRFFEVIVPLLPEQTRIKISEIQSDSSIEWHDKWILISEILQDTYNTLDKKSKESLFSIIKEKLYQHDTKIQEDSRKTIIHKISLDDENLEYSAKGSVPGNLLNQFSMDEHNGKFRVATTNEYYIPEKGNVRYNAVYVLDENLNIVGSLDEIAPNESIFSARFMDDRLYLVTFERIDPFFVIDLSKDTPKVLGELKIPGFSNYLHPYDDDHVIGIGRDTIEKDNRVRQLGIKIALFDVSDVSKPSVVDEVVIGNQRTDSMALGDHRAFLFDKNKDILSIPIHSRIDALGEESSGNMHSQWNGFYVYGLNASEGFELKGKVQHTIGDSWPYSQTSPRSFYIGDVLYTTSDTYLKMNDLENFHEINSLRLDKRTGSFIDILK